MTPGIVTKYLISMIAKQVEANGLVVWYDPEGVYPEVAKALDLADTTVLCYEGSFIHLRWEIDQKGLMDGEEPPRLVVYVPVAQEETHHALIELEAAGVVMQPGQQPPIRNTRLALVARNALKGILGDEAAVHIEKQAEAGRLTLADLDALADKGGGISKGIIHLIFSTGNPQEVALSFLNSDQFDETITKKDARGELIGLLRQNFGLNVPDDTELSDLRLRLARYVLMTDLISGLGDAVPSELASVPVASIAADIDACKALARTWRMRRDMREGYVATAQRIEQEIGLAALDFTPEVIKDIETFPTTEETLLRHAESQLLENTDGEILTMAKSRLSRFWCDVEPRLQARWALVASAAEVLLEADRVEQALKKAPASATDMIKEYAKDTEPWCLLDTYHRHMESRWYNFEAHGNDHDSIEKLVIQARHRYMQVGSGMARCFLSRLQKKIPGRDILRQYEVFERYVRPSLGPEKTAYVWVDALRYEMGRELARLLGEDFEVDLYAAIAAVPTITEIGMAALLPCVNHTARVVAAGNGKLALEIGGTVVKDRRDRVAFLKGHAGVKVFETKLDALLPKPAKKIREGIANAQLILVTSQEIDELCEQDNITQARRQMDGILNDIRRGIWVLQDMGIERIVLAADHGYIFGEELGEDMKIDAPGGETIDLHRRVWVGRGGSADDAFLRMPISMFDMQGEFDIVTPWTFACFRCKGGARAYFHGGLSLQELLIPVITLTPLANSSTGLSNLIQWRLIPGSQKLSTRFFSVQITGKNTGLFDILPPKVRVELRAKRKTISRAISASYGFEEATGDVVLRNDEKDPKRIVPNTVTLMVIEEPEQKSVGIYLLDAATGAELSRIERIEVAISI